MCLGYSISQSTVWEILHARGGASIPLRNTPARPGDSS